MAYLVKQNYVNGTWGVDTLMVKSDTVDHGLQLIMQKANALDLDLLNHIEVKEI